MTRDPFPLFRQFEDCVSVAILDKSDDPATDAGAAAAVGAAGAAGLWQVHGSRTVVVRGPSPRVEKADGMITGARGLALAIRWADCQNFVVYEPKRNVLGVMHVGWRGLLAGTIGEFFAELRDEFSVDARDAYVAAGPSLCMKCSEFGEGHEVLTALAPELVDGRLADLQGEAAHQLLLAGVRKDRIDRHHDCTRCMPETYWTYRGGHREEVLAGRTNMLVAALA